MIRVLTTLAVTLAVAGAGALAQPSPAHALSIGGVLCKVGSVFSGIVGRTCELAARGGRVLAAGKKLLGGHLGQALGDLTGSGATGGRAVAVAGLAAIAVSIVAGARHALKGVAAFVSWTTEPNLGSVWFSGAYWRMAGIAFVLTVPFLLAAVGQAVIRSDLGLLVRAAFGLLPLSGLAVGLAIPLTILLLRGSDAMAALASGGQASGLSRWLLGAGTLAGLDGLLGHDVFLAFLLGLLVCAMTLTLWVELAIRQAAVSVIVLMLPIFFAALVWPARRIWALRALELLVALVLSKFVIVAVLALGAAALDHAVWPGPANILMGLTLVTLAAFSPWALLRMLPLHELASGAVSGLAPRLGPLPAQRARAEGIAAMIAGSGEEDEEDEEDAAEGGGERIARAGGDLASADLVDVDATDDLLSGDDPPRAGQAREAPYYGLSEAARRVDERSRRPRPDSDVDPAILNAPDQSWRPIRLDEGELDSDEPLQASDEDPPEVPDEGRLAGHDDEPAQAPDDSPPDDGPPDDGPPEAGRPDEAEGTGT